MHDPQVAYYRNRNELTSNQHRRGIMMPAICSVPPTLSCDNGLIALGSDIGQPVWDAFGFSTSSGGGIAGEAAPVRSAAGTTLAAPAPAAKS
jgi:hypothetical protein